jgi:hypothetical protein
MIHSLKAATAHSEHWLCLHILAVVLFSVLRSARRNVPSTVTLPCAILIALVLLAAVTRWKYHCYGYSNRLRTRLVEFVT